MLVFAIIYINKNYNRMQNVIKPLFFLLLHTYEQRPSIDMNAYINFFCDILFFLKELQHHLKLINFNRKVDFKRNEIIIDVLIVLKLLIRLTFTTIVFFFDRYKTKTLRTVAR